MMRCFGLRQIEPLFSTRILPAILPMVLLPFLCWASSAASAQNLATSSDYTEPSSEDTLSINGIYPHLAMWNEHGECGTGALLPWAGKLWVITYAPHQPLGSTDKLYSIDTNLRQSIFPDSVGGTPANRMIHKESQQAIIGPYFIDSQGNVRVIRPQQMPGRLTAVARHLKDPANLVYFATMEEGLYEVNVHTLEVHCLFPDDQHQIGRTVPADDATLANLPGYHGKGLYSGQGRLIYANNGESSVQAQHDPETPSGCLAQWDGNSKTWEVVRRNQFTDICGPGGLQGNLSDEDPIWAIGWDHRSLILMLLEDGQWFSYRLPKASHCYDGAHGWNTEWPRFRQMDPDHFLLNMHGMFWDFPASFRKEHSAGIRPKASYLKVVGDYCQWNGRLVLGCDDTAANEFLNKRKAKGEIAGPGQSHSNLWFLPLQPWDSLGPSSGRGSVWTNDPVKKQQPSDPFLFAGFQHRQLCLTNHSPHPVAFQLQLDRQGSSDWEILETITVGANESNWHFFKEEQIGEWIRVMPMQDAPSVSAHFSFRNVRQQSPEKEQLLQGLASFDSADAANARVRVRGELLKALAVAPVDDAGKSVGFYQLDESLTLAPSDDSAAGQWTVEHLPLPAPDVLQYDQASAIYTDDEGSRWRFPVADPRWLTQTIPPQRIAREAVTERDLFQCGGSFYELPARNAGGVRRVRAISTPNRLIHDFCSYRGLLVLSGLSRPIRPNQRIHASTDQKTGVWLGVIDDLWSMGTPEGVGGPWKGTPVNSDSVSDPFFFQGYQHRTLHIQHDQDHPIPLTVELDVHGNGDYLQYQSINVLPGKTLPHQFPAELDAYWIRFRVHQPATMTTTLVYSREASGDRGDRQP